jgi:hypothetical protein
VQQQQQEGCEMLCTKSGGGGLAFRPQKTLSCANFEYLSAFARAEQKKSHSPGRYFKALFHLFWGCKRRRFNTYYWFRKIECRHQKCYEKISKTISCKNLICNIFQNKITISIQIRILISISPFEEVK